MQLGKMKKIKDLRSVWKNEPKNFSKWLSEEENLNLLGNEIGVDMTLDQLESRVGDFSVDILATEVDTNKKIIIENQLEDTNHDHLGKIITYASGKNAEIIIWIVKRAREEHRKAIEWLNDNIDAKISFFLVEIELWQIDNSPLAPHFNVIERPNDWAKNVKNLESLSGTKQLQYKFWQAFCDYAFKRDDMEREFSQRKTHPQHWYTLGVPGKQYTINTAVNTQKKQISVDIYIPNDKDFFHEILNEKQKIENMFGSSLEWIEAGKDCRIVAKKNVDIKNSFDNNNWNQLFDWLITTSLKMKEIITKLDL